MYSPGWGYYQLTQRLILFRLTPLGRALTLPHWASASWTNAFLVIVVVTDGLGMWRGPWAHMVNVTLLVVVAGVPLLYHKFGVLNWVFQKAWRLLYSRSLLPPPEPPAFSREPLGVLPNFLFYAWAAVHLSGQNFRRLNRAVFALWALYFVVGCVLCLCRGVVVFWRLRRSAFDPALPLRGPIQERGKRKRRRA